MNETILERVMYDALFELRQQIHRTTTLKIYPIPDATIFGEILEAYRRGDPDDTDIGIEDIRTYFYKRVTQRPTTLRAEDLPRGYYGHA